MLFPNHFRIKATHGVNSTLIQNLNIISCLCTNSGTCNFDQITTISETYQLATCICPAEYEGKNEDFMSLLITTEILKVPFVNRPLMVVNQPRLVKSIGIQQHNVLN